MSGKGNKDRLQEFLTMFKKSDGGKVDRQELLDEVFQEMDQGALVDDKDEIAKWAKAKGMSAEESTTFADSVLFEYYGGAASAEEDSQGSGMAKSLSAMSDDMNLVVAGMAQLIEAVSPVAELADRVTALEGERDSRNDEINTLKSKLAEYEKQPGESTKQPDTHVSGDGEKSGDDWGKTYKTIMKGVLEGVLGSDDIREWEANDTLTDDARNFIESAGRG